MRRPLAVLTLLLAVCRPAAAASEGQLQANAFAKVYATACLKYVTQLDALREQLRTAPKLAPDRAAAFLGGRPGDAWSIPDEHGELVLALPEKTPLCALHERRADTEAVRRQFDDLMTHPPSPLTFRRVEDVQKQTAQNGLIKTVSYEWAVPDASHALLFTLTVAPSETAQLQVLGSASVVKR